MNGPEERDTRYEIRDSIGDSLETVTEFERELTRAMRCVEAPSGFADGVMARAEAGERASVESRQAGRGRLIVMTHRWRTWASGAIAALIVLGALQGERVHQQHERQAEAQRQFEAAERITDQALTQVRAQVQRAISSSEAE